MIALNGINQDEYHRLMQFKPFGKKIKAKHELNRDTAIKILKNIEISSKIKSILTKPVIIILATWVVALVVAAPYTLPLAALAMRVSGVFFIAGFMMAMPLNIFSIPSYSKLSREYNDQSLDAHRLIQMLKVGGI